MHSNSSSTGLDDQIMIYCAQRLRVAKSLGSGSASLFGSPLFGKQGEKESGKSFTYLISTKEF